VLLCKVKRTVGEKRSSIFLCDDKRAGGRWPQPPMLAVENLLRWGEAERREKEESKQGRKRSFARF